MTSSQNYGSPRRPPLSSSGGQAEHAAPTTQQGPGGADARRLSRRWAGANPLVPCAYSRTSGKARASRRPIPSAPVKESAVGRRCNHRSCHCKETLRRYQRLVECQRHRSRSMPRASFGLLVLGLPPELSPGQRRGQRRWHYTGPWRRAGPKAWAARRLESGPSHAHPMPCHARTIAMPCHDMHTMQRGAQCSPAPSYSTPPSWMCLLMILSPRASK